MALRSLLLFLLAFLPLASCPFCDPKVLEVQGFYEDDLVIALIPYKPIVEGHALIIPKRHVAQFEELTPDEITQIGIAIKKVHQMSLQVFNTHSYILHQKNGFDAGQSVFHLHFHYVPKKENDDSTLKLLMNIILAQLKGPLSREELLKQKELYGPR